MSQSTIDTASSPSLVPHAGAVDYVRKAQDFELPKCVKLTLEADIQQASAIAIVMALMAVALVSLAQIVAGADQTMKTDTASWGALRVFLYSAIMLNLGGAFLSLISIKMYSDLPLAAQQTLLREGSPDSLSPLSRIARNETLDVKNLGDHFRLLRAMGVSPGYQLVDLLTTWMLITACICTFAALTFWVLLSETIATAGVTMVIFGPVAIIVMLAFRFASLGQGWK